MGCQPIELYDFAEDREEIEWETALLITSVRRDYFLYVQDGAPAARSRTLDEFPPKKAKLDGIAWLPRLILKAQARLRGELPHDLMYCCGGDRKFFREHRLHPADFLRVVWKAGADDGRILRFVRRPDAKTF